MNDDANAHVERDVMEYDVVAVGAGPAGLAFAIRLKQIDPGISVCVIEKSSTIGAHILSGAVIEPGPLDALLPGWRQSPPPVCVAATEDEFWHFTRTGGRKFPFVPPGMNNHGNFIVSLGAMCAWLAPQAEALGVEIYPGFAAAETLHDHSGKVIGVRIGDMGVAKDGSHKPGYTAGIDIHAKVTVLAEGARGHLTKRLVKRFDLSRGHDPQSYSIGIKELWQVPEGRVSLRWEAEEAGALRLEWRETGGPPVTSPDRRGFGLRMIERALAADLAGRVDMEFRPEGLVCRIDGWLGETPPAEGEKNGA